jgi:TolB-like protein
LETICARCLERDPKARYQSAGDLAADLERWLGGHPIVARPVSPPARIWRWSQRNPKLLGAATAGLLLGAAAVWLVRGELFRASPFNPPDRSIAVLPFTDSSDTKDQGYLCDGISEEILDTLTQVDSLHVAGRTSSFSLKGRNTKEVGEKLNVGNVLEGRLQRQANRVRVTAELIDARNGFRVWTETYERELDGAFALQDEIARSIVDALKIKLGVRISAHEQPGNNVYDLYLQRLLTDVTQSTVVSGVDISVPVQNQLNPFTVPDYTSAGDIDRRPSDTRVTAAPPETGSNTSARDRALEPGLRTNKIRADVTPAPPGTGVASSERYHASEAAPRTNKITADGSASIQGFVKDAKGEPIEGADVRIESRNGKQVFSTVKTDPKGRYISQGLEAGVYRVTLLVNGAVKASIMNTQTKANQPTQLNFDFKPTSQAGNIAKGGKHMVWVPNRTGSHLGGAWVEVDDKGSQHAESNIETYTARRW